MVEVRIQGKPNYTLADLEQLVFLAHFKDAPADARFKVEQFVGMGLVCSVSWDADEELSDDG